MAPQQDGRGCAGTFLGCFGAGLLILVILGAVLYFVVPKFLRDADHKILPWLESKGRVLTGKMALQPLIKTIDRSDLPSSDKKAWKDFLTEKWERASASQDRKLRREVLINASRDTVGTYAGLYYALLAIGDRDFKETSLTGRQIETGQKLITTTTSGMLDGAYSLDELAPVKSDLFSVLTGWRIETEDERGRREQDNNLRDFFRSLYRLDQAATHSGDNRSMDMESEFTKDLEAFKKRILQEEAKWIPDEDDQGQAADGKDGPVAEH